MEYKYDYAVFIGRFQPYHIGHHHVAKEALKIAKNLIFVIGSHDKPRDSRNPFTTLERINIIKTAFFGLPGGTSKGPHPMDDRVHFVPQVDHPYNEERWIASVQTGVASVMYRNFTPDGVKVCIIGYDKDHSSYYLKKFPQWDIVHVAPKVVIDATSIRKEIFHNKNDDFEGAVSDDQAAVILNYADQIGDTIRKEFEYIKNYQREWGRGPFVTVDGVVTQAGHILLVERGAEYGGGQWALPGGFINPWETLLQATLRELREETRLKVPTPVLVGSIAKENTYDYPYRSNRARIISHAYHFKLNDVEDGLPKVKGSDDAAKSFWVPLSEFKQSRNKMFEDHYGIIEHMLGI